MAGAQIPGAGREWLIAADSVAHTLNRGTLLPPGTAAGPARPGCQAAARPIGGSAQALGYRAGNNAWVSRSPLRLDKPSAQHKRREHGQVWPESSSCISRRGAMQIALLSSSATAHAAHVDALGNQLGC